MPKDEIIVEDEEIVDLRSLIQPPEESSSLAQFAHTQKALAQVKKSLSTIVDSMAKDPSMLSRAAKTWGKWSVWEKASVGIVLTVPTLAIGLVGHLGVLLVLSGTTALVYTTGGYILDDHYQSSGLMVEKLKAGVLGITEILALTIGALDNIRVKFEEELLKLTANVNKLGEEVGTLNQSIDHINEAHEDNQRQLTEKIAELTGIKTGLELEIEKARLIASVLQKSVASLSGTVIEDKENRRVFQEKLDVFLANKEASFDKVADRISAAEAELTVVKGELQRSNERYQELLQQQEKQVSRLERIGEKLTSMPKGAATNPYAFHCKPIDKSRLDTLQNEARQEFLAYS